MKKASPFETKPCTRCGGSGHYSYCTMYGTTCFGCGGKGVQFTKRGAAARAFYLASMVRRYDEIQTGWRIFDTGSGWRTVTSVEVATDTQRAERSFGARGKPGTGHEGQPAQEWIPMTHRINTQHVGYVGEAHETITAYADSAERDALLAAAVAYQETLTQAGTPRKRSAPGRITGRELAEQGGGCVRPPLRGA